MKIVRTVYAIAVQKKILKNMALTFLAVVMMTVFIILYTHGEAGRARHFSLDGLTDIFYWAFIISLGKGFIDLWAAVLDGPFKKTIAH